jgi:hypothetical protein
LGDTNRALPLQRLGLRGLGRRGCPRRALPPWSCGPLQSLVGKESSAAIGSCAPPVPLAMRGVFAHAARLWGLPFASPAARLATTRRSSPEVPPSFEVSIPTLPAGSPLGSGPSPGVRAPSALATSGVHRTRVCLTRFVPPPGFSHPLDGFLLPKPSGLFHPDGAHGVLPFRGCSSQGDAPTRRRVPCPPGVSPVPIRLPWSRR